MSETYTIDYDEAPQRPQALPDQPAGPVYQMVPQRRFAIPAILKTSTAFVLGAAALFSAEMWGPDWLRPSTPMGMYEAKVEQRVAEADSRAKAPYQAWGIEVQGQVNQSIEQYKAKSQAFLTGFQAYTERTKLYAQMIGQLQSQLAAAQISRVSNEQSGEVGLISMGRMIGNLMNAADPGAGDDIYNWSSANSERLKTEIDDAVINGRKVSMEGWDTGLPDVAELQRQLDAIPTLKLPPMPSPQPAPAR